MMTDIQSLELKGVNTTLPTYITNYTGTLSIYSLTNSVHHTSPKTADQYIALTQLSILPKIY